MFNKIKSAMKNPDFFKQYITRSRRLADILKVSESEINNYFAESLECWQQIEQNLRDTTGVIRMGKERLQILYTCIRSINPKTVVETGVAGGGTSLTILTALKKNGQGKLYSIDVGNPNYVVGWMVPNNLRVNWNLTIADSKKEMPILLDKLKEVDVFFHDSLHTYEHMMFEFEAAYPYLQKDKFVLSDDIDFNSSFDDFIRKYNLRVEKFYGFGVGRSRDI